jgi:acetylornithine/succinyldiaminopimelate/putrescine aminotransferase
VLETVNQPAFLKDISRKGDKIQSIVRGWNDPRVKETRGRGLMLAVDIEGESWPVLERGVNSATASKPGLLVLGAGKNTLRLLPPYIIGDAEIEQGLEILRGLL